jgi:flagellar protein FliO/FliZ
MKPSAPLLAPLLALACAAALLLFAPAAQAQRFPRQLENIKMFGTGETLQFVFSKPYEGSPVVDAQKGSFSLTFSGTGSTKPVRALRPVEESMYKEVKVVENRYSTTVTFLLKDPTLNLRNKLAFTPDKNVLKVAVNAPATKVTASPQAKATQDLLKEMESRIAGDTAPAAAPTAEPAPAPKPSAGSALALGDLGGATFFYSLVTMVIALVIIVGALYGLLFLYNRYLAGRLRRFTGSHAVRQVASFHIGPRQRIVVLEINDEVIACGVTPSQITYLTHLGGKGPIGRAPAGGEGGLPGSEPSPGKEAAAALPPAVQSAPVDPVHQFAEVLKQKVRSLKRIN